MLSDRAAADLLAGADSLDALGRLAGVAGFRRAARPFDSTLLEGFDLAGLVDEARIVEGEETLRALLVRCRPDSPLRNAVSGVATRLTARSPHLLWFLVALSGSGEDVALAAWSAPDSKARIAALLVERSHVRRSDAETVQALASAPDASDVLTHANWLEILGRQALTRRFYRALERAVAHLAREARGRAAPEEKRELALLAVSRLLFLSFLATKGWLNGDHRFLEAGFARCMETGGCYHRRILTPLCFGTLNTPAHARARAARAFGRIPFLNGGLFAPTPLERRTRGVEFTDEHLGGLFRDVLGRYRFTAREDADAWSETAIDPEMLGKAFESLMASVERRASGAFYTPHLLVARVTESALASALGAAPATIEQARCVLRGASPDPAMGRLLRERLRDLRILDPSCGSGAFLVHALERVAEMAAHLGDARGAGAIRRDVLAQSIFGVDVNPTAVWLCELRLWLAVVVETSESDPADVPPLPNLDRHIRMGDSLSGESFGITLLPARGGARVALLRQRYARATGTRKRTLGRALDSAERAAALAYVERALEQCAARRRELLTAVRGRDLFGDRIRPSRADRAALLAARSQARDLQRARRALREGSALPFAWGTHFPDIDRRGGFDIVVGNPPWVRLHRIPALARAALRARFRVFAGAAWTRGAAAARAGSGFAAQVDMAALFAERSLTLARVGGTVALLLPAKLWHSLAGGGVRRLLRTDAHLIALEDWSESSATFDAAVYPSLVVARRDSGAPGPALTAAWHRKSQAVEWALDPRRLGLDDDPASPWLLLPDEVRAAFDRFVRSGVPLGSSHFGAPQLGVKCGCNDAFVVTLDSIASTLDLPSGDVVAVRSGARTGWVERALLRPVVRGRHAARWNPLTSGEWLFWTHDAAGEPLPALPEHGGRWLSRWRRALIARSDVRHGVPWWSLFRAAGARPDRARLVWADVSRGPRAFVQLPGDETVALNSCYVLPATTPEDALALAALLNSPLAAAWVHVLAEPARGGFRRCLAWTMALLPIPNDWARSRPSLAALGAAGLAGDDPSDGELLDAALRAYRLRPPSIASLLTWVGR